MVVCSRTDSDVNSVKEEIEKVNSKSSVLGVKCDVSMPYQVNSLIRLTIEKFGNIDILVNNAGVAFNKKLVDTSEKEWDQTINTNLKGAFLLQRLLPSMFAKRSGVIINVNSGAGKVGFSNLSAYASKFGPGV